MVDFNTALYILGGIAAAASSAGAYFSGRNHAKLNSGSTVQITSQPITMAALPASTIKTIIVDGVTYTQVTK